MGYRQMVTTPRIMIRESPCLTHSAEQLYDWHAFSYNLT